jgi:hypothetical protein
MDLSKLPKLSQTPKPPENEAPQPVAHATPMPTSVGAEAWICIAIGLLVLLVHRQFFLFFMGKDIGILFFDEHQQPLAYTKSIFFINDLGLVAFGFALILDGIVLLIGRPAAIWIGFIATVLASVLNIFTIIRAFAAGMPLQIYPAVAFALGVYTALYQWKLLRVMRTGQGAPMT